MSVFRKIRFYFLLIVEGNELKQILQDVRAELNKRRDALATTKNSGFTMVEMVVVIVVITIVAGLTVSGIIAWQDWARFKKENETAQTLFVAAQNQLSEYGANGRLDAMVDELEAAAGGSVVALHPETDLKPDGADAYDMEALFPESAGKSDSDKYTDEIYALVVDRHQFDTYISDPSGLKASDLGAYYACEILGSYVYDTSILNEGAFVVEMTTSGQVFSILYSDRNDSFTYGDKAGGGDGNGVANIANRDEVYRQDRMIGYYGVDTLYKMLHGVSDAQASANLRNVRLHNEDTFYLTYDVEQTVAQAMTYTIKLYDSVKGQSGAGTQALQLVLDGTKLKAGVMNAQNISCKVTRGDTDNLVEIGEFPVLAYVENDPAILKSVPKGYIRVHVLLDAADIQATTYLYDAELADIHSAKASQTKFSKTYSIFRFGMELTTGRMNASVSAKADGYVPILDTYNTFMMTQSDTSVYYATKNAFYSVGTMTQANDGATYDYTIKNARHLYNVRYIEDITYDQEAGKYKKNNGNNGNGGNNGKHAIKAVNFKLGSDIDWAKFQQDGNLYDTYSTTGYVNLSNLNKAKGENVTRYNCDFPSISQLRTNDTFTGAGALGKTYTISGIEVSEVSNAVYGLYLISDNNSQNPTVATMRPTGLFDVNYGAIEDLYLDQIVASGSNMVGGFCGVNAGKLDNLTTLNTNDKSVISGSKNVGGIMGFQLPVSETMVIENLVNRANVQGVQAVGGIVGMIRNDFSKMDLKEMRGLSHTALGQMKKNAVRVSIEKCTNYGTVSGVNSADLKGIYEANTGTTKAVPTTDEAKAEEPRYIGGIAGYTYNNDSNNTGKIKIVDCVSSPQFERNKLNAVLSSDASLKKALKGVYVGGIVGLNHYGEINNCQAKAEKNTEGYLFGCKYVGGIVGFNIGPASGVVGTSGGKAGVNENHVVAYDFAGGIVGCNASVKGEDSLGNSITSGLITKKIDFDPDTIKGLLVPEFARALDVKIDNWTNKGVVIATHEFAGGIAGMNAGWIYRCNSEMDVKTADAYFDKVHSGDYAGGIAGYNNGIIGNTSRSNSKSVLGFWRSTKQASQGALHTVCYVRGHSYVGGIVGYNDVNSIVEDYDVSGGYVIGEDRTDADGYNDPSCFVGGYAGFNAAVDLLTDGANDKSRQINSNPNEVRGTYFVGGNIGGNIISDTDAWDSGTYFTHIEASFRTDNFLGTLEGKAFVGGFVGYNMVVHDVSLTNINGNNSFWGQPFSTQEAIVKAFKASEKKGLSNEEALKDKVDVLDNLSDYYNYTAGAQYIRFTGQGSDYAQSAFGTITAEIYVGGVLGYNNDDTKLYVLNVENATPVFATNAILNDDEQKGRDTDYLGRDMEYTYSYAGGIIGKVSENAEINNCHNAPSGMVETKGTYTGGLCEINEGKIINCNVGNFGNTYTDYLGGLCGLNKATGIVEQCTFDNGKTVSGRNVVGGMVAENFGTIRKIELEKPRMIVAGKTYTDGTLDGVTGLYAAYNAGTIELEKDIMGVNIESGGRFVGAVVGFNNGTISNKKTNASRAQNEANRSYALTIVGNITGYQAVGSLVGRNADINTSHRVEYYMGNANVTATNGNAGGIIGENESKNTIQYCYNKGVVNAPQAGNAGGITSTNSGLLTKCVNYKEVAAPKGMCGGMVAINNLGGTIRDNKVCPEVTGSTVTFTSSISVGGIAAQNAGLITSNTLTNVIVTNKKGVIGTSIGIVAGQNLLTGEILVPANQAVTGSKAVAQTNNCFLGGIAGTNNGLIHGNVTGNNVLPVVNATLVMDNASYAAMGGIAGKNTGTIRDLAVDSIIDGKLGTATSGYGGIAGYSGYATKKDLTTGQSEHNAVYPALITNCTFDGTVHVTGSAGSPARGGGIVGINANGSKIEECFIGVRANNASGAASTTTYITAGDQSKDNGYAAGSVGPDTASYAYLGGIAGENFGWIGACDNRAHSTDVVNIIGFAGETGGIVGYNNRYGKVTGYAVNAGTDSEVRHLITTGDNWLIEMRSSENDRGPGGIIGMSVSAEDMEYVDNYAKVQCWHKGNNKTGGIIGVIEQNNANNTNFRYVNNYGDIEGYANACGITCQVRASGLTFEYCNNYGNIKSDYRYAAGFCTYAANMNSTQGMKFYHCENHGNIYCKGEDGSSSAGGFLGSIITPESGVQFYFYDCVNTGIVTFKDAASLYNRCGSFVGVGGATLQFENCRNYNTKAGCANGWVGNGGTAVYNYCLDDSGNDTTVVGKSPYGGSVNQAYNAFYLDTTSGSSQLFDTTDYGVYFNYYPVDSTANNTPPFFNGSAYHHLMDASCFFTMPSSMTCIKQLKTGYITFEYAPDSQGLDSFIVCLATNNFESSKEGVANTYTATFYYADGSSSAVTQSGTGSYDVTDASKLVFTNPKKGTDNKPIGVKLVGTNTPGDTFLHGFLYKPMADSSKEAVCTYAGKRYDTTFSVDSMSVTNASGTTPIANEFNNRNTPTDTYYKIVNDFLTIPAADYKRSGINASYGDTVNIQLTVDNQRNTEIIKSFVFYLANDNTSATAASASRKTFYYSYSVSFLDAAGHEVETAQVTDVKGYDSGVTDYMALSRQEVEVPAGLSGKVASIVLHITTDKVEYVDGKGITQTLRNTGSVYFRKFAWIPKGTTEEIRMASGINAAATKYATYTEPGKGIYITRLLVDSAATTGRTPYVYVPYNKDLGFYMDYAENDPISATYYGDDARIYADSITAGLNSNSRIDTYLDIDPKFPEFAASLREVKHKLATPVLTLSKVNGSYQVKWGKVANAYEYEVFYTLRDFDTDQVVYTSPTHVFGSAKTTFEQDIDNVWADKHYKITFYVKAINAYHRLHDDPSDAASYAADYADYDSVPGEASEYVEKKALPVPEAHLEIISGNRTVLVLDNYDEYVEEDCTDCTLTFDLDSNNVTVCKLDVSQGKYSAPFTISTKWDNHNFRYYVAPNASLESAYANSIAIKNLAQAQTNDLLPTTVKYATNDYFYGFYGADPDSMEYYLGYNVASGARDSYVTCDITSMDENIGATVAYDHEMSHIANSAGKTALKLTTRLKNLPTEWFGPSPVDKIVVRNYLHHSQNDMVYYGHDVAKNVALDGATAADNIAILQAIADPYYFAEGDETNEPSGRASIYDDANGDLYPGYVLYKNDGGYYDVYYNATLEMAKTDPSRADGQEYRNRCVTYVTYESMELQPDNYTVNNVNLTTKANRGDYMPSYWVTALNDKHNEFNGSTVKNATQNEPRYIQEVSLTPCIETSVASTNAEGLPIYTFTWDAYFRDEKCYRTPDNRYYDTNLHSDHLTNPSEAAGVCATWDLMSALNGGYEQFAAAGQNKTMFRFMNSYLSYYSKGSYRVDLFGVTTEGEETLLETQVVDAPVQTGQITGKTTWDETTSTTYTLFDYECTFTDNEKKWTRYPQIVARISRQGSIKTPATYDYPHASRSKNMVIDGRDSSIVLPRYDEVVIMQKQPMAPQLTCDVQLAKDDMGQIRTDALVYDVGFGGITDPQMREDLGGYLITVESIEKADGQSDATPTHYFYVTEIPNAAAASDEIGIYEDQLTADGSVLTCLDGEGVFTQDGDVRHVIIDLADFTTGEKVNVSVKAIARKEATTYTDSLDGIAKDVIIPVRLAVPDTSLLIISSPSMPDYDAASVEVANTNPADAGASPTRVIPNAVDLDTYQNGYTLYYDKSDTNYADASTAKIYMAVAVFDENNESDAKVRVATGDSTLTSDAKWNADAYTTIYSKANAYDMGYVSNETVFNLDITEFEQYPGQFAGKWLKVALIARDTTKIDSQWTDNDASDATVNYKWIHIPKLYTGDVATVTGDNVKRYIKDSNIMDEKPADMTTVTEVSFATIRLEEQRGVDGYSIRMIGVENADSVMVNGTSVYYTKTIDYYMQKHLDETTSEWDGTWDVYAYAADGYTAIAGTPAGELLPGENPSNPNAKHVAACEQNAAAAYIGNMGSALVDVTATPVTPVVQQQTLALNQFMTSMPGGAKANAQLRYTYQTGAKTGVFELVLPAPCEGGGYLADAYQGIASVGMTYYLDPAAASAEQYVVGNSAVFVRSKTASEWKLDTVMKDPVDYAQWMTDTTPIVNNAYVPELLTLPLEDEEEEEEQQVSENSVPN